MLYNSDQYCFSSVCELYILRNIRTVWHISLKCAITPKPKIPPGQKCGNAQPRGQKYANTANLYTTGGLKYYFQAVANFLLSLAEIQKQAIFDILMTITLGLHMITRQMTPFSSSFLQALPVDIFCFCISKTSKLNIMGSVLCNMCWPVKYTFTCQK